MFFKNSTQTRNSLLIAIAIITASCADCFQGVHINFPLEEEDKQIIQNIISLFPRVLNNTINCTDLRIYYDITTFDRDMANMGHYNILGLCTYHNGYSEVFIYRMTNDYLFIRVVIHEFLHTIGYKHGDEMENVTETMMEHYYELYPKMEDNEDD